MALMAYKLENRCVFVDAKDENGIRIGGYPPQIIDKRPGHPNNMYYELSEKDAFILRYLLLKVPKDAVSKMYDAEFGGGEAAAATMIDDLVMELQHRKLLKGTPAGQHQHSHLGTGGNFGKPLDLSRFTVGTNQIGWIVTKLPHT